MVRISSFRAPSLHGEAPFKLSCLVLPFRVQGSLPMWLSEQPDPELESAGEAIARQAKGVPARRSPRKSHEHEHAMVVPSSCLAVCTGLMNERRMERQCPPCYPSLSTPSMYKRHTACSDLVIRSNRTIPVASTSRFSNPGEREIHE